LLANNELLLAMGLALGRTIRLNLTGCATCQNVAVVAPLKKVQQRLSTFSRYENIAIELVFDEKSFDYQERTCNRREFFSLLRNRSKRAGISVVDRLSVAPTTAYGSKQLPVSRQLLLQVLQQRTDLQAGLATELFPHRVTAESCRDCTGCVGICPTGALAPPAEMPQAPSFVAERCIACKLCEDFCTQAGTQIICSATS
jgi:ferredoxin